MCYFTFLFFFFFNDTATTEIYTLSLHDALQISRRPAMVSVNSALQVDLFAEANASRVDRKSTRLNSSYMSISYAAFCLKKKKKLIKIFLYIKKKKKKKKPINS